MIVLDFDGVICDSIDECLMSSWLAYYSRIAEDPPDRMPRNLRSAFAELRPSVRSGEDYVLIHELLAGEGEVPRSQEDFDSEISRCGPQLMSEFKDAFYASRGRLLEDRPEYWYSLNRIFPHMQTPLRAASGSPDLYILSTKRSDFVNAILGSNGIHVDRSRVLYTDGRDKLPLISELLDQTGAKKAVFVDDQVDHFASPSASPFPRIECRLATWGYIRSQWLLPTKDYTPIDEEGIVRLLRQ